MHESVTTRTIVVPFLISTNQDYQGLDKTESNSLSWTKSIVSGILKLHYFLIRDKSFGGKLIFKGTENPYHVFVSCAKCYTLAPDVFVFSSLSVCEQICASI